MKDFTTVKMFGTGQITIPKKWREKIDTVDFLAKFKDEEIVLTPLKMEDDNEGER